ncbi:MULTISPECIES: hypothetical protein [Streptomycetaceae]|uniref:Uncharacterized protein n=1 Tax=Streptantibioticus cattleyicolor (strain ATCC 35852 / DSM 46488 / JCM 4925 / NBRC 14057 / NRRL 8057) TaxID=1003195 RepID=F8JV20_STREN|nr:MULTISPECIES: hypothetical protein [Streptomycetaceae]AEW98188.1 hypothetical protein SCATT_58170 [Streptantibioticus cattleyicolor NRRL 8057 = DSM 46488]MYS62571.1 hypothetical protein [Streptomyces sp. SID5468]CCB78504.1 protein of unknown function [Streptantibioticus cattleyicolor NRRL 8057 = DSM 46488]
MDAHHATPHPAPPGTAAIPPPDHPPAPRPLGTLLRKAASLAAGATLSALVRLAVEHLARAL